MPGRRPSALFALATLLAVIASSFTRFGEAGVWMLWLAPPVMLVGLLVRGPSVLFPGALGIVAGLWVTESSLAGAPGALTSSLLGPMLAARILQNDAWQANQSHQQRATSLLLVIVGVMATTSSLALVLLPGHIDFALARPYQLAWQWLVDSTSGVIAVRCLLAIMPADGSGFCPMSGVTRSIAAKPHLRRLPGYLILIAFLSSGALVACQLDLHLLSRMSAIPILAVASVAAIASTRREASGAVFLAVFGTDFVRTHTIPQYISTPEAFQGLAEYQLLVLFVATLLTLLNSITEERKAQESRLRHQTLTNTTSQLPNAKSLMTELTEFDPEQANEATARSLLEVSIVGLFQWVDITGREAVTKTENEIAHFLRRSLGEDAGNLYHLEAGVFVLLGNSTIVEHHRHALTKVFERKEFRIGKHRFQCQIALAIVDLPPHSFDAESAMTTLSLAQQQSLRNSDYFCRYSLNERKLREHRDQLTWIENVRLMLKKDHLRLYGQSILNCQESDDKKKHFEVLARMVDHQGNVLTPDKFLPAIAQAALHVSFDQQVISLSLKAVADYNRTRGTTSDIGTCAINIMGPTICDRNFAEFLIERLRQTGVNPRCITLEVTESESILDIDSALINLKTLSDHGIQIAVDDFGTGLATFDYIRKIRPDLLKIDGSFVTSYETDPLDQEIVHSVIRLARAIGARTVAEFVEDENSAQRMKSIGVNYLQGFGIGKPVPLGQLLSPAPTLNRGGLSPAALCRHPQCTGDFE